jgi:hypothetical protein
VRIGQQHIHQGTARIRWVALFDPRALLACFRALGMNDRNIEKLRRPALVMLAVAQERIGQERTAGNRAPAWHSDKSRHEARRRCRASLSPHSVEHIAGRDQSA